MAIGLSEFDFYRMTLSEVNRYIEAYKEKQKNKLSDFYTLAKLIGISIGTLFSKEAEMPSFYECFQNIYPEEYQDELDKQSISNLLNFAHTFNNKKTGGD